MTFLLIQQRFRMLAIWSWGLMALCLPFSTALTMIFSTFGVLFGLMGFDWGAFKKVMLSPIAILSIALFAWLALSMLWSIAPRDELIEGISKYRKLLYVPLVAMLLVSTRIKPWFLMNFFVVGCLVVCLGSLSSTFGLWEHLIGPQLAGGGWGLGGTPSQHWFYIGPPEAPTFGRAYIAQGAFLVISAVYLLGFLLHRFTDCAKDAFDLRSVAIILAIVTMMLVALNLGGRTGYLLLVAGAVLWVLKMLQERQWKLALGLSLSSLALVAGFVGMNPKVIDRTQAAITDVEGYQASGALTSQGLRLRFWEAGIRIGLERPMQGWGVGSYAEVFSRDNGQPIEIANTRPQPHSEWVLLFVQGGGVALLLLTTIGFFVAGNVFRMEFKPVNSVNTATGAIAMGTVLMLIGGGFNSVIWDLAEGHKLALLLASLLACSLTSSSVSQKYVPRRSSTNWTS